MRYYKKELVISIFPRRGTEAPQLAAEQDISQSRERQITPTERPPIVTGLDDYIGARLLLPIVREERLAARQADLAASDGQPEIAA